MRVCSSRIQEKEQEAHSRHGVGEPCLWCQGGLEGTEDEAGDKSKWWGGGCLHKEKAQRAPRWCQQSSEHLISHSETETLSLKLSGCQVVKPLLTGPEARTQAVAGVRGWAPGIKLGRDGGTQILCSARAGVRWGPVRQDPESSRPGKSAWKPYPRIIPALSPARDGCVQTCTEDSLGSCARF